MFSNEFQGQKHKVRLIKAFVFFFVLGLMVLKNNFSF